LSERKQQTDVASQSKPVPAQETVQPNPYTEREDSIIEKETPDRTGQLPAEQTILSVYSSMTSLEEQVDMVDFISTITSL
jgi:hypothetical protein